MAFLENNRLGGRSTVALPQKKEAQLSLRLFHFRFQPRAADFNFAYRGGGPIWKPG